jgi:hypothetical protein
MLQSIVEQIRCHDTNPGDLRILMSEIQQQKSHVECLGVEVITTKVDMTPPLVVKLASI